MIHDENFRRKYNPYLPNIRYTSQNEEEFHMNHHYNDINERNNSKIFYSNLNENPGFNSYSINNNYDENNMNEYNNNFNHQLTDRNPFVNKKILLNSEREKEKENYNNIFPQVYRNNKIINRNQDFILRKNNSQVELYKPKLSINNNSIENKNEDFSNFIGKIKIINFYSSSEIILLIENIISELNLRKDYTFVVKDSFMCFTFNDAEQALSIFKRINIEKLKNKYYQNLVVDIKFEIKEGQRQIERTEEIKEIINDNSKNESPGGERIRKTKVKKLSLLPNMSRNGENKKMEKFKNIKTYNYSKDNILMNNNKISDDYFNGIYKNYVEYFKHRKEERRKRELNYQNGKDISLLASSPYIENINRKSFQENLRKNKGINIAPSKFNGFIEKASVKKDSYKENHLYNVPDFINHWKLREDNKNKWISSAKFQV